VHNAEDVRKALQLGSSGVLIASAIVKSKNPGLVIENILEGFE
jgi:thiazole synthase ThiGH ThiG subunit